MKDLHAPELPTLSRQPAIKYSLEIHYWGRKAWRPQWLADVLDIRPATVRLWIYTGSILAFKVGRSWRIPRSEIERVVPNELKPNEAELASIPHHEGCLKLDDDNDDQK